MPDIVPMERIAEMPDFVPMERIADKIYLIRQTKVMLDFDLAELYGVPTKALKQAVRRNQERFPSDFLFELSQKEFAHKLADLEQHIQAHDEQIQAIFEALRQLMSPPETSRKKIYPVKSVLQMPIRTPQLSRAAM